MSLNLGVILRESANKNPDRTAMVLGDVKIPYGVLHGYAQRFAGVAACAAVDVGGQPQPLEPLAGQIDAFKIAFAFVIVIQKFFQTIVFQ